MQPDDAIGCHRVQRSVQQQPRETGAPQVPHRDNPPDPHPLCLRKDPQVRHGPPVGRIREPHVHGVRLQVAAVQFIVGTFLLHDEYVHSETQ
ncbi:hypothetical protein ADK57_39185 [Streptomyces sp. MMG1533]|nr:hypothetical protein ADK57_39185 [Streptomyces sp. MMG1533]